MLLSVKELRTTHSHTAELGLSATNSSILLAAQSVDGKNVNEEFSGWPW